MRIESKWTIARLTTFEEFDALACEWGELLSAARIENVFLTHFWLREWWRTYGRRYELWTLVARGSTGLAGVAPLILDRGSGGARRLIFMGENEIQPDHLDLIIRPELRAELTHEFWSYLWRTRTHWDILDLDYLPAESPTRELLTEHLHAHGLTTQIAVSSHSPYIVLPDSFDEYLQSRGHGTRKQLRRSRRRLMRDFPAARFGRVETKEELDAVFDALVSLHQARWTGRGYQGVFSRSSFVAFHRAVAHEALARDALRLYFLQVDSVPVATHYCYHIGSRVFTYSSGFDGRIAEYSAGTLMRIFMLEQSTADGAREVDLLQGEEAYKAHWATGVRACWRLRAVSPHTRGRLAWMRMKATDYLVAWFVKHIPHATRIKVRHLLRLAQTK